MSCIYGMDQVKLFVIQSLANQSHRPFQDAVKAGTGSIMCSYQRVNNSYGCANSKLLNGLLKTELGFQVCPMPVLIQADDSYFAGFRGL